MSKHIDAPPFGRRTQLIVIPTTNTIAIRDDEGSADYSDWKARRIRGVELRPRISAAAQIRSLYDLVGLHVPTELEDFPKVHRDIAANGSGVVIEMTESMIPFPDGPTARCCVVRAFGQALQIRGDARAFDHTIIASATMRETEQWATASIVADALSGQGSTSERVEAPFDTALHIVRTVWGGVSFAKLLNH